ncbi:14359_t:CDS:2 [Gigaspora margarita]|uniref:14359_t:CDS:1 n=1 Tax=Gigaspora margarita TaxID=4874 RepID=A0ABM8W5B2_GIGMA|nr:14359_t:CDS:2 [Gigaspora margarita]
MSEEKSSSQQENGIQISTHKVMEYTKLSKKRHHLAAKILNFRNAIYLPQFYGYNLVANSPYELSLLRDEVIKVAHQEIIRREFVKEFELRKRSLVMNMRML